MKNSGNKSIASALMYLALGLLAGVAITKFNGKANVSNEETAFDPVTDSFPSVHRSDRRPTIATLLIGVQQYAAANSVANPSSQLLYAKADVEAIHSDFSHLGVPATNQIQLVDEQATLANINRQLQELAAMLQPDDRLIVFFAGHGFVREDQSFLVIHDGVIAVQEIVESLESARQCQVVLSLDACHSGGDVEPFAVRGDLSHGGGLAILYAAATDEQTHEFSEQQRGVFSFGMSRVLRQTPYYDTNSDGWLDVDELSDGIRKNVDRLANLLQRETALPNAIKVNWRNTDGRFLPLRHDYQIEIVGAAKEKTKIRITYPPKELRPTERLGIVIAPATTRPLYYPQTHINIGPDDGGEIVVPVNLGDDGAPPDEEYTICLIAASHSLLRRLNQPRNGSFGTSLIPIDDLDKRAAITVKRTDPIFLKAKW